jgi:hypothetical protein
MSKQGPDRTYLLLVLDREDLHLPRLLIAQVGLHFWSCVLIAMEGVSPSQAVAFPARRIESCA